MEPSSEPERHVDVLTSASALIAASAARLAAWRPPDPDPRRRWRAPRPTVGCGS